MRVCDPCYRDATTTPSKRDREEQERKECGGLEAMVEVDYSNLSHWEERSSTKASIIVHQGWAIELNDTWHAQSKRPTGLTASQGSRATKDILDKWRNKWFRVSLNPNQFAFFTEKPNPINKKTSDCNPLGVFPIDGYAEVSTTSLFRRPFVLSMQTMARSWLLVLPSQEELNRFKMAFEKTIHAEREIQDAQNWDERHILPDAASMSLSSTMLLGRDMMAASYQDAGILDADVEARIGIQVVILEGADSGSSEESGSEDGEAEAKDQRVHNGLPRSSSSKSKSATPTNTSLASSSLSVPSTSSSAVAAATIATTISTPSIAITSTLITTNTADVATTTAAAAVSNGILASIASMPLSTAVLATTSNSSPSSSSSHLDLSPSADAFAASTSSTSSLSTSSNNDLLSTTLASSYDELSLAETTTLETDHTLEHKSSTPVGLDNLQLNPDGLLTLTRAQAKLLAEQGTLTLGDGKRKSRLGRTQNATLKLSKKGADALDALSQLPTTTPITETNISKSPLSLPKESFGTQPDLTSAIVKIERFALDFPGTGIVLSIKGVKPAGLTVAQVSATILGEEIWVALNNKTAWAARTALRVVRGQLPMMLCPKPFLSSHFMAGETGFDIQLGFGTKGKGVAGQLSAQRCIKRLRFLAERDGDPWMEFLFQYYTEDQVTRETAGHKIRVAPKKAAKAASLFKWQTRPSLLLKQIMS